MRWIWRHNLLFFFYKWIWNLKHSSYKSTALNTFELRTPTQKQTKVQNTKGAFVIFLKGRLCDDIDQIPGSQNDVILIFNDVSLLLGDHAWHT